MKRIILYCAAWLAMAISLSMGLGALAWSKYFKLARGSISTQGLVIDKEPYNHRSVRYSYMVDKQSYTGLQNGASMFDEVQIGDAVEIFYLPVDPRLSCLCNPKDQLVEETIPIVLVALIFPTIILLEACA